MADAHDRNEAQQRVHALVAQLRTSPLLTPTLAAAAIAMGARDVQAQVRTLAHTWAETSSVMKLVKRVEAAARGAEVQWVFDMVKAVRDALVVAANKIFISREDVPTIDVQTPQGMVHVVRGGESMHEKGGEIRLRLSDAIALFDLAARENGVTLPQGVFDSLANRWVLSILLTKAVPPSVTLDAI